MRIKQIENKPYIFFSDIHGQQDKLMKLMLLPEFNETSFVFLGDAFGDGDNQYIFNFLQQFHDKIIWVMGDEDKALLDISYNNLDSFVDFVTNKNGQATLRQLGYTSDIQVSDPHAIFNVSEFLNTQQNKLLNCLRELPMGVENKTTIGVHAGVNPNLSDWTQSRDDILLNIRLEHYFTKDGTVQENKTGKTIVAGHNPVQTFKNRQTTHDPLVVNSQKMFGVHSDRIAIDGGLQRNVQDSALNLVKLNHGDVLERITL